MATDLEIAVDKITDLLSNSFDSFNTNDTNLDKKTAKFWKRLSKRLPEGFGQKFEAAPKETAADLKAQLLTLGENSRIQMNFAMYLYDMGIPIE